METRIRLVALILDEARVLLVSTKKGRGAYLVPPGGGLENGETLQAGVEREVWEEAGVRVRAGALIGYRHLLWPDRFEVEMYFSAGLLQNPETVASVSNEQRRVQWVSVAELATVKHFPARLAELCEHVQSGHAGALYLGQDDLSEQGGS